MFVCLCGKSYTARNSLWYHKQKCSYKNNELDYNNTLMDWGKSITEAGHANIYEYKPGGVNFGDPAWWLNKFAEQGTTLGIAAESMLEVIAVTALTEGTGLGAAVANVANKFKALNGMKNIFSAATNAEKLRRSATTWAVFRRYNESVIEAKDSFDERLQYYQNMGLEDGEARKNASIAAATTFKANMPLVVLDILQARLMTFNPVTGGSSSMVDDILLSGLGKKTAIGVGLAGTSVAEGME